jgi:hypothetical protein
MNPILLVKIHGRQIITLIIVHNVLTYNVLSWTTKLFWNNEVRMEMKMRTGEQAMAILPKISEQYGKNLWVGQIQCREQATPEKT